MVQGLRVFKGLGSGSVKGLSTQVLRPPPTFSMPPLQYDRNGPQTLKVATFSLLSCLGTLGSICADPTHTERGSTLELKYACFALVGRQTRQVTSLLKGQMQWTSNLAGQAASCGDGFVVGFSAAWLGYKTLGQLGHSFLRVCHARL